MNADVSRIAFEALNVVDVFGDFKGELEKYTGVTLPYHSMKLDIIVK